MQVGTAMWLGTIGVVVVLLALDLALAALRPHRVGFGEAVSWSVSTSASPCPRSASPWC